MVTSIWGKGRGGKGGEGQGGKGGGRRVVGNEKIREAGWNGRGRG